MIDVHSHIIPGIDDGAKDLETALSMLKMAAADGITEIVATPHVIEGEWLPKWEKIVSSCLELHQIGIEAGLNLRIYPGAEVALTSEVLNKITGPGPYCINETSYILVELPTMEVPISAEESFFKLRVKGLVPLLAHPELNEELNHNFKRLEEWVRKGILLQVNAGSIEGRRGKKAMKFARKLLLNNMVYCIGSDSHGIHSRLPQLSSATAKIRKLIGVEKTDSLINENPQIILHNQKTNSQHEGLEINKIRTIGKSWNLQC
jgi:protein-tyrosine phosphatase